MSESEENAPEEAADARGTGCGFVIFAMLVTAGPVLVLVGLLVAVVYLIG